jgi:hypothetical protein
VSRGALRVRPLRRRGRADAEHVGAPDQLVELAIVDERSRVEIDDLCGAKSRPASRVETFNRTDRQRPDDRNQHQSDRVSTADAHAGDDDAP